MRILLMIILFTPFCCAKKETRKDNASLFEPQQSVGVVEKKLREASGLVASKSNPGYLWTLNDGGNPSNIYLLNDKAEIAMTVKLSNIVNRDWEDIVIGPGPEGNVNYIYVAEIGDNDAVYNYKMLYRFKEPVISESKIEISEIDALLFQLPGGPRDTETMMVDPLTMDFYIVSKREPAVRLYEIAFPFDSDTLQVKEIETLPFKNIVAASISGDGQEILMKNYNTVFYWKRTGNESIVEAVKREPVKLEYHPEPQGESIAWSLDGKGFYTLSESEKGAGGTLYYYQRK